MIPLCLIYLYTQCHCYDIINRITGFWISINKFINIHGELTLKAFRPWFNYCMLTSTKTFYKASTVVKKWCAFFLSVDVASSPTIFVLLFLKCSYIFSSLSTTGGCWLSISYNTLLKHSVNYDTLYRFRIFYSTLCRLSNLYSTLRRLSIFTVLWKDSVSFTVLCVDSVSLTVLCVDSASLTVRCIDSVSFTVLCVDSVSFTVRCIDSVSLRVLCVDSVSLRILCVDSQYLSHYSV